MTRFRHLISRTSSAPPPRIPFIGEEDILAEAVPDPDQIGAAAGQEEVIAVDEAHDLPTWVPEARGVRLPPGEPKALQSLGRVFFPQLGGISCTVERPEEPTAVAGPGSLRRQVHEDGAGRPCVKVGLLGVQKGDLELQSGLGALRRRLAD